MRNILSTTSLLALLSVSNAWGASASFKGWDDEATNRQLAKLGITLNSTTITDKEHLEWAKAGQAVALEKYINESYNSLTENDKEAYKRAYVELEKAKDPTFSCDYVDDWALSSFVNKSIRYDLTKDFTEGDLTILVNQIDPTLSKDRFDVQRNEGGRLGSLEIKRKEAEFKAREEAAQQQARQKLEQEFSFRAAVIAEQKRIMKEEAQLEKLVAQKVAQLTLEEKKAYGDELFELKKGTRFPFPTREDVREENIAFYAARKIREQLASTKQ